MPVGPKKPAALSARNADRHALYEIAVQRPEVMIGFIEDYAEQVLGRTVSVLREDFCGTANLSAHWVCRGEDRRATGVDHDGDVLEWADRHNRRTLGAAGERLKLVGADVMRCRAKAEVIVALNFSPWIYHDRPGMLAYLRHARRHVRPGGMVILDAFGGPGSIVPCLDERPFSGFDYLWEQVAFDPVTGRMVCRIHFRFPNGSMLRSAFEYDWRMWTLPELRDLLAEAGFASSDVYFESEAGFIHQTETADGDTAAWVAYLVGLRD